MKEVGLVAKGPGWELSKNYSDMELWGVNDSIYRDENIDLCFFMDRELLFKYDFSTEEGKKACQKAVGLPPNMIEEINNIVTNVCNERSLPVYCTKAFDDIPSSMAYPIDEIKSYFGTDYFGNSLDYMIALAIYQGYEIIHTFGLNMSQGTKYIYEKPSTTFWLGVALGKGIELHLHGDECGLLKTMDGKTYAYREDQVMSQENLKIADESNPVVLDFTVQKTFPLTPLERMLLLNSLPDAGRYKTIKKIEAFKKELEFTLEEEKKLALHHDGKGKSIKFVEDGISPKDMEISSDMQKIIRIALEDRDKKGLLNKQFVSLYERFVLGE